MTLPCGCCATLADQRRAHGGNRPWLSAIDYRLGTFATFREEILDQLAASPELTRLRSRVSDDYAVASVELWAAVADVLTFYTERIANEAFVRTATLRDSVLRLVRVIDYQLAPGAAATTALAFTLEKNARALIPARSRVQSVPAEGETPQKYETLEPLAASGHLNRLRLAPRPSAAPPLAGASSTATAAPDAEAVAALAAVAAGDHVILYNASAMEVLTASDVTAVDDRLGVRWLAPVSGSGFTAAADATQPGTRAYRLGRSFHVFGHDAPPIVVVSGRTDPNNATTTYLAEATTSYGLLDTSRLELDGRFPDLKPGATVLVVSSVAGTVRTAPFRVTKVGEERVTRSATYKVPNTNPAQFVSTPAMSGTVTTVTVSAMTNILTTVIGAGDIRDLVVHELVGDPLRFWPYAYPDTLATGTVFVAGRRAGWSSIEVGRTVEKGAYHPGAVLDLDELPVGRRVIAVDDRGGAPVASSVAGSRLVGLDVTIGATTSDSRTLVGLALDPSQATAATVLVSAPLAPPLALAAPRELSLTIGNAPTQTITLDPGLVGPGNPANIAAALQVAIRAALPGSASFAQAMAWASGNALLVAAGVPDDPIRFGPSEADATTVATIGLDPTRARYLDGVLSGRTAALAGTGVNGQVRVGFGVDPPVARTVNIPVISTAPALATALGPALGVSARARDDTRILLLPPIPVREPRSWLQLDLELAQPLVLDAATAALLGNVANASHGETVRDEIVGDGDASQAFQRFPLRKSPVTYVPAPVAGGAASSLMVFINGAQWTEVPTLYGKGATEEVFTTRLADDGTRTVQLGDGATGARAKTGRANIVATYRQGIGLAGRVRAGTLTTLLDRPTGLKGATNPTAADGGADPESLEAARTTAPGTVRTFGRAVSLRDFEDATLVAGEVAKVTAAWVWNGRRRIVHVTVAGQGGTTFSAAKLLSLETTLGAVRDPNHRILIANYARVPVLVAATIMVDDRHVAETVLAAARTALAEALSFERRAFVEAVDLSDVYAVLQGAEGVRAVDIDRLDFKNPNIAFRNAHGLDPAKGELQPRLLMLPARLGGPATILPAEMACVDVPALDLVLRSTGGITL